MSDKVSVIALDPSLNETGWAVRSDLGYELSGVFRTHGENDSEKLFELCQGLDAVLAETSPERAIVEVAEGFTYSRSFSVRSGKAKNARSIYKNGKAVGAIIGLLMMRGVEVVEIGATFWKGKLTKKLSMAISGKANHNESDALLFLRWYWARYVS